MKKGLPILGIHDGHNVPSVFIGTGEVIAAVSEERFSRCKVSGQT